MTRRFDFQQVDVFASAPLKGNALAVVIGADALTFAKQQKQFGLFSIFRHAIGKNDDIQRPVAVFILVGRRHCRAKDRATFGPLRA